MSVVGRSLSRILSAWFAANISRRDLISQRLLLMESWRILSCGAAMCVRGCGRSGERRLDVCVSACQRPVQLGIGEWASRSAALFVEGPVPIMAC